MNAKITALFRSKPIDENSPVTKKEFWRERASLGDEIDNCYRSIVRLSERIEDLVKENKTLKDMLKAVGKRVLD